MREERDRVREGKREARERKRKSASARDISGRKE